MNYSKMRKMRVPVELKQLQKSHQEHGIRCLTLPERPDDFSCLEAFIPGPKESPYENGIFKISIHFGEQYPFRPPIFKFVTPIFHPNIDNSGKICLDILRMPPNGSYNPAITLESILLSIQLLLSNPNPEDPLRGDAADLYKSNKELFFQTAKEHVAKYCRNQGSQMEMNADKEISHNEEVKKKKLKLNCK